ncbi:MAG: family 10 glycosylhydrolase [Cyclonatronaceae bacterium]
MKNQLLFLIIAILVVLPFNRSEARQSGEIPEAPKHEFRSVWVATALGLDWPKTTNAANAELALRNIIRNMKAKGMNAVVFQVTPRGDAYYQSDRLPWARRLTGTMGQDPGWDPLAVAIEEAHKHGMELHAWYNVGKLGDIGNADLQDSDEPRHIYFANPDLIEEVGTEVWLNHGKPQAREWAVANVIEIVEKYDVDAIHFDFIRYPSNGYANDFDTKQEFNPENIIGTADWRRYNVNEFNRMVYDSINVRKPWVKVGSTPIGHYKLDGGWPSLKGYSGVYQDSRRWLQEGVNDYLAPQLYWDIGGADAPQMDWLVRDWMGETYDRHIYIGTGPYKANVFAELPRQIDSTRVNNAAGQMHFRYDNIVPASTFGDRYDRPSIVPPMPWKEMTGPNTPANLISFWPGGAGTELTLEWEKPDFGRGEPEAVRYAIYRVPVAGDVISEEDITGDATYLIAVTGETTFTDAPGVASEDYDYYVTALSRNNVESVPAGASVNTSLGENRHLARSFELDQNYPNPFNPTTNIRFTLGEAGPVSITVYDLLGRVVAQPLNDSRPAGTHTISFNASHLSSGVYLYRLESGSMQITKKMMLIK